MSPDFSPSIRSFSPSQFFCADADVRTPPPPTLVTGEGRLTIDDLFSREVSSPLKSSATALSTMSNAFVPITPVPLLNRTVALPQPFLGQKASNTPSIASETYLSESKRVHEAMPLEKEKQRKNALRLSWTKEMHAAFVLAYNQVSEEDTKYEPSPQPIFEKLKKIYPQLTRRHVASHLQKYRNFLYNQSPPSAPLASLPSPPSNFLQQTTSSQTALHTKSSSAFSVFPGQGLVLPPPSTQVSGSKRAHEEMSLEQEKPRKKTKRLVWTEKMHADFVLAYKQVEEDKKHVKAGKKHEPTPKPIFMKLQKIYPELELAKVNAHLKTYKDELTFQRMKELGFQHTFASTENLSSPPSRPLHQTISAQTALHTTPSNAFSAFPSQGAPLPPPPPSYQSLPQLPLSTSTLYAAAPPSSVQNNWGPPDQQQRVNSNPHQCTSYPQQGFPVSTSQLSLIVNSFPPEMALRIMSSAFPNQGASLPPPPPIYQPLPQPPLTASTSNTFAPPIPPGNNWWIPGQPPPGY